MDIIQQITNLIDKEVELMESIITDRDKFEHDREHLLLTIVTKVQDIRIQHLENDIARRSQKHQEELDEKDSKIFQLQMQNNLLNN